MANPFEQVVDARGALLDGVADEVDLRRVAQAQRHGELAADVRGGLLERLERLRRVVVRAGDGHEDLRVAQIVGHPHVRHRDHHEARIVQLVTDDLRDLLAHLLRNSLRPTHKSKR